MKGSPQVVKKRTQHKPFERVAVTQRKEIDRLLRAARKRRDLTAKRRGHARARPDLAERVEICSRGFFARLWWALGVARTGLFRWQRGDYVGR